MSFLQDIKRAKDYIGKPLTEIPVPAFIIDKSKVRSNSQRMLNRVNELGVRFRPHVNAFKAIPVVREQLGQKSEHSHKSTCHCVIALSVEEIRNLVTLVEEEIVTDVLYVTPIGKSQLKELAYLRNLYWILGATLHIVIDHPTQLDFLLMVISSSSPSASQWRNSNVVSSKKWSIFVDVEVATAPSSSDGAEFSAIINQIASYTKYATNFRISGFYCRGGPSSNSRDLATAEIYLQRELAVVINAAQTARKILSPLPIDHSGFILSVGTTPTAHVFSASNIHGLRIHPNDKLEVHAGNYVALDLQQVATSLASKKDIAGTVLAEVCSYYPSRKEYIISSGKLALTSERGPLPGIAHIQGTDDWIVTHVTEQYGTVSYVGHEPTPVTLPWRIGDRMRLYPQNAPMTSACHKLYFVVDANNIVIDIWTPWKYW